MTLPDERGDETAAGHGVTGGTQRIDGRMEEEPTDPSAVAPEEWVENTEPGGEAGS